MPDKGETEYDRGRRTVSDERWMGAVDTKLVSIDQRIQENTLETARIARHLETLVVGIHAEKQQAHLGFDTRIRELEQQFAGLNSKVVAVSSIMGTIMTMVVQAAFTYFK